jgi:hypothetical protein
MNSETQQLSPSGSPAPQPRSSGKEIAKGIASCFALNLLHLGAAFLFIATARHEESFFFALGFFLILGFAVAQSIYVVPIVLWLRKKKRTDFAKGMIIASSLSFLLGAICWATGR